MDPTASPAPIGAPDLIRAQIEQAARSLGSALALGGVERAEWEAACARLAAKAAAEGRREAFAALCAAASPRESGLMGWAAALGDEATGALLLARGHALDGEQDCSQGEDEPIFDWPLEVACLRRSWGFALWLLDRGASARPRLKGSQGVDLCSPMKAALWGSGAWDARREAIARRVWAGSEPARRAELAEAALRAGTEWGLGRGGPKVGERVALLLELGASRQGAWEAFASLCAQGELELAAEVEAASGADLTRLGEGEGAPEGAAMRMALRAGEAALARWLLSRGAALSEKAEGFWEWEWRTQGPQADRGRPENREAMLAWLLSRREAREIARAAAAGDSGRSGSRRI